MTVRVLVPPLWYAHDFPYAPFPWLRSGTRNDSGNKVMRSANGLLYVFGYVLGYYSDHYRVISFFKFAESPDH
jgi:hypothetical protein